MTSNYRKLLNSESIPGRPAVCFDSLRRTLVHVYEHVPLETSNFQTEVNYYLNRKESYSGNVLVVSRIKDEQITYNLGGPAMEVSVVTEYVPWRLGIEKEKITREQALFLLDGACRGFRELLHRVRFPFVVQTGMIGVDGKGDVKVWWNDIFFRSNFGFSMETNTKLRVMVRSLVKALASCMDPTKGQQFEKEMEGSQATFVTLDQRIKQLSLGMDFKQIGKSLLRKKEQHIMAMRQSGLQMPVRTSMVIEPLQLTTVGKSAYSPTIERVILTPRRQGQHQFNKKLITKRTYRDGASPKFHEKIQIIKDDIQNLRSYVNKDQTTTNNTSIVHPSSYSQTKMRSSKSVESIFSYTKAISGDKSIPEVNKIIKELPIISHPQDLTISRFVQAPMALQSSTSIAVQHCSVCSNVQELRKSQMSCGKDHNDPMFLSRLQSIIQDKSVDSTSRSMNESRLQKIPSADNLLPRFGESEKKLPGNVYFTSFFEA